jgi:ketosteroid isomerase-like protein
MYTSEQYDEFQVMKFMLGKHILKGQLYPVEISVVNKTNVADIATTVKETSNNMEFMKRKYNLAGVRTHCMKADQYLLVSSKFDATMDVNVLATSFNMDKAQFMGHRVPVDSFGEIDTERLDELFAGDDTYTAFTTDELTALDAIPAVLLDKDWFMVFDRLFKIKEVENGEGLYWNYDYHVWKTFSVSPFANNALFIPGTPSVTSITLSPATATVSKGQSATFSATVVVANFAPKTVNWTINSELSTIDNSGNLIVGAAETASTITVTATSVYDGTKTGTATVTIAA